MTSDDHIREANFKHLLPSLSLDTLDNMERQIQHEKHERARQLVTQGCPEFDAGLPPPAKQRDKTLMAE